jgi:hypothetical protein
MGAGKLLRASVPVLSGAGINVVPIAGLTLGGWPPETTMAVYIVETALLVAVTALRLRLLAPARLATTSGKSQSRAEAIQGFLLLTGGFTLAGAIFSAFFLSRTIDLSLTLRALAASVPVFLAVQAAALLADLLLLRQGSQAQAERWMLPGMRRGCVLYGAVFGGALAAVFGFGSYVYPFIALKLLMDVGVALEEAGARLGAEPPPSHGVLEVTVERHR